MSFDVIKNGVRFECQGSGKCCLSRGEFGYVYMNLEDRHRMAKELGLTTAVFTRKYCKKTHDGFYHLNSDDQAEECMFLKDGSKCSVYKGRPVQCRTWPFWPEMMNAKSWKKEVKNFCPAWAKASTTALKKLKTFSP